MYSIEAQQPLPQPQQRRFLELTLAGSDKKLYLPADAILSYEQVLEGKNPHFPKEGGFLRYDYGEGLMFSLVSDTIEKLEEEIGTEGFITLTLTDDSKLQLKDYLIVAIQEVEEEGGDHTRISIILQNQVGSLLVKESFKEIQEKRGV
jgi:hypothetical protein